MSTEPTKANPAQEEGCFGIIFERKYYRRGNAFIKRNLRPREYRTGYKGLHIPRMGKERLKNEASCLEYIRQHTDIPVPQVYCHFEDDDAYYLITEYIEGVGMSALLEDQKSKVQKELVAHVDKLKSLTARSLGGLQESSYRLIGSFDKQSRTPGILSLLKEASMCFATTTFHSKPWLSILTPLR